MKMLSVRQQVVVGGVLALLMAATRGQHFTTLAQLPSASWAVFFLAGVYLRSPWVLLALLAETWILDFSGYVWGGGSGFCLTSAYVFLLPAYSALWFAGRWYARQHVFAWKTLLPLGGSILGGFAVCKLISSGSFYFFSGRFAEPSFAEFGARLLKYGPVFFQSMLIYVALSAGIHILCVLLSNTVMKRDLHAG